MPDNAMPTPPPAKPPAKAAAPAPAPEINAGHPSTTEEFDSAKWTLPPIVPLLVATAIVAVLVSVIVLSNRTKPSAGMEVTKVVTADQQGNTMVAIQVKIENKIEKPLWIKSISAEVEAPDGKKYNDNAAPSMDAPRYMQAFPDLEAARADWLKEDLKIPTKTSFTGTAIFAYPIGRPAFEGRKALTVRIQLYDQPTLVVINTPAPRS